MLAFVVFALWSGCRLFDTFPFSIPNFVLYNLKYKDLQILFYLFFIFVLPIWYSISEGHISYIFITKLPVGVIINKICCCVNLNHESKQKKTVIHIFTLINAFNYPTHLFVRLGCSYRTEEELSMKKHWVQ